MLSNFFQSFIVLGMYNFDEWWLKFRHIWKHQKHLHGRQGISLFKFQATESPKANWDRDIYLKMVLKFWDRDIWKTTTFWNSHCEPIIHYGVWLQLHFRTASLVIDLFSLIFTKGLKNENKLSKTSKNNLKYS